MKKEYKPAQEGLQNILSDSISSSSNVTVHIASLLKLPDELLLGIIDQLPQSPRYRHNALVALNKTCRRLRRVAQEPLYVQPYVAVCRVSRLVSIYLANPDLAKLTKAVEVPLHSRSKTMPCCTLYLSERHASSSLDEESNEQFKHGCLKIIKSTQVSTRAKREWIADVLGGQTTGFMCILLRILPNLTTLLLGSDRSNPIDLCEVRRLGCHVRLSGYIMPGLDHSLTGALELRSYSHEVFKLIVPSLHLLELPLEWQDRVDWFTCLIQSFSACPLFRNTRSGHRACCKYPGRGAWWPYTADAQYKTRIEFPGNFHFGQDCSCRRCYSRDKGTIEVECAAQSNIPGSLRCDCLFHFGAAKNL